MHCGHVSDVPQSELTQQLPATNMCCTRPLIVSIHQLFYPLVIFHLFPKAGSHYSAENSCSRNAETHSDKRLLPFVCFCFFVIVVFFSTCLHFGVSSNIRTQECTMIKCLASLLHMLTQILNGENVATHFLNILFFPLIKFLF